jgi:hypothetical protein
VLEHRFSKHRPVQSIQLLAAEDDQGCSRAHPAREQLGHRRRCALSTASSHQIYGPAVGQIDPTIST